MHIVALHRFNRAGGAPMYLMVTRNILHASVAFPLESSSDSPVSSFSRLHSVTADSLAGTGLTISLNLAEKGVSEEMKTQVQAAAVFEMNEKYDLKGRKPKHRPKAPGRGYHTIRDPLCN